MGTLATNSPADLISDLLRPVIPVGWAIFVNNMPASPDQAIVVNDTGGRGGIPNLLVDYVNIQVLVRGRPGDEGVNESHVVARLMRDHLLGRPNAPAEFVELDGITERNYIAPVGYDESRRHVWSNNFELIVEPGPNAVTHRFPL